MAMPSDTAEVMCPDCGSVHEVDVVMTTEGDVVDIEWLGAPE